MTNDKIINNNPEFEVFGDKIFICVGNDLYYWNQLDHAYDLVDYCQNITNAARSVINNGTTTIPDMDFGTGGHVYGNSNKPEDSKMRTKGDDKMRQNAEPSKMHEPEKKTKRGFDDMLIADKLRLMVDKIYLNGSHTCVVWRDGTKTVVNCADEDYYDEYAAFTAALAKRIYGNNTALKRMLAKKTVVQKPLPGNGRREIEYFKFDTESISSVLRAARDRLNKALLGFESVEKKDDD